MTPHELGAFVADVRAEAERALERLARLDFATLPPDVRDKYEEVRVAWEQLRALTEPEAVGLHEAACLQAGRELTPGEMLGLLLRQ